MTDVQGIAGERIRSFVERVERLNEEKRALNADVSEVYKEAKGSGFDVKALKRIVQLRAMDDAARDELETLVDLYLSAMRNSGAEGPHVHAHTRDAA